MHVVTFYSYKGGVGRTLALVNVAFELLRRGKRVLLVDFDLEAPGLPSYEAFAPTKGAVGIVDYVTEYLRTNASPDVADYVVEVEDNLLVIPAGKTDVGYATRLASIDWQKLYAERDGYLMFEDMRAQWAHTLRADYVLIDSRTGHNDIGGICTRQFPDVVVGMFFPNMQNIDGMSVVAKTIKEERESGGRSIECLFVSSRVPALDDELEILAKNLKIAEGRIGYPSLSAVIHQYDSMALVSDAIFVRDRPKTRLAREYGVLTDSIVMTNVSDSDGAAAFLENLLQLLQSENAPLLTEDTRNRLETISLAHANNGRILEMVADVRYQMLEYESAYQILSFAVERGHCTSTVLRKRAAALQSLGRGDEALYNLQRILELPSPSVLDVIFAVRILVSKDPSAISVDLKRVIQAFSLEDQVQLAETLNGSAITLSLAEDILRNVLEGTTDQRVTFVAQHELTLVLVGSGKFNDALNILKEVDVSRRLPPWYFNQAMASWGYNGNPEPSAFEEVIRSDSGHSLSSANYSLCMAVAFGVIGDGEHAMLHAATAERAIRQNPVPTFSPWRYLTIPPAEFRKDIAEVRRFIADPGAKIIPEFIQRTVS